MTPLVPLVQIGPGGSVTVVQISTPGPAGRDAAACTVAGVAPASGDYPASAMAAALGPLLPGGGRLSVPFAFGDAAAAVYTAPAGGSRLVGADLSVRTPFNGAAPTVTVAGVLAASDSDPTVAGIYSQELDVPLAAGQTLTLTIAPDSSTRGAGVLTLSWAGGTPGGPLPPALDFTLAANSQYAALIL